MGLISLNRNEGECKYNTMLLLTVSSGTASLRAQVCGKHKVRRGESSPGREVKCSHGTLHYLVGLVLYPPEKRSHVIQHPRGRILEQTNETTVTHSPRQFLQLRMFKTSTFTTLSLLKLKMKKSKTYRSDTM